jgi:hypothetical protein
MMNIQEEIHKFKQMLRFLDPEVDPEHVVKRIVEYSQCHTGYFKDYLYFVHCEVTAGRSLPEWCR